MAVTFSGILGLNKTMMSEIQGGNFEALMLARSFKRFESLLPARLSSPVYGSSKNIISGEWINALAIDLAQMGQENLHFLKYFLCRQG